MNLSSQEIESVSKLEPFKRYTYFIKKIADFEEIWTIVDKNGDIALADIDHKTFISFWSHEDYIQSNLENGWKDCQPFKITLDDFEDTIIALINENDYLLNIFPVMGKSGFIVNLNEFMRDLNEELEQYH